MAALLVVIAVLLPWGARAIGQWLMVADPLEPAKAIVVLSCRVPFRALEAACYECEGVLRDYSSFGTRAASRIESSKRTCCPLPCFLAAYIAASALAV